MIPLFEPFFGEAITLPPTSRPHEPFPATPPGPFLSKLIVVYRRAHHRPRLGTLEDIEEG